LVKKASIKRNRQPLPHQAGRISDEKRSNRMGIRYWRGLKNTPQKPEENQVGRDQLGCW